MYQAAILATAPGPFRGLSASNTPAFGALRRAGARYVWLNLVANANANANTGAQAQAGSSPDGPDITMQWQTQIVPGRLP